MPLKKHASPERKAHAYLLLSAYTRDEMSYEEVARITGPQGDYPFTDGEMSRSTLDRIVERAARTGDPAFRKVRATVPPRGR
jgi:transposase